MSEISFYKQSQDYRVLNKTLDNPLVKQVNMRTDIDIYNPVLYLQDFDTAYNYFAWDSRYYFIQSAYYTAKQIWRLQCHIDVLMSYKDAILTWSGVLERGVYPDNVNASIPYEPKAYYRQVQFTHTRFERDIDQYILIATGMYYEDSING